MGNKVVWKTDGSSNLDELSMKTKDIMLRRLKTEVLDMPDKTISVLYHDLDKNQKLEYDELWDEYNEERVIDGKRRLSELSRDLVELGLLRKFIAMCTIPYTIEKVNEALENNQKVVIFTTFTEELMELKDYFNNKCVIHHGSMSDKNKQESVDQFQNNNNIKVFIGNIISAGVGITLTAGTVVVFNSFDWVPGNNEQAEDRCYRLSQPNNVTVYYHLFKNTISLAMWFVVMNKQSVINRIMGSNENDMVKIDDLIKSLSENGVEMK